MKTIGFIDKCCPNRINAFSKEKDHLNNFFGRQKRYERIYEALENLRGLGNCYIVYIKGNKYRIIEERSN